METEKQREKEREKTNDSNLRSILFFLRLEAPSILRNATLWNANGAKIDTEMASTSGSYLAEGLDAISLQSRIYTTERRRLLTAIEKDAHS